MERVSLKSTQLHSCRQIKTVQTEPTHDPSANNLINKKLFINYAVADDVFAHPIILFLFLTQTVSRGHETNSINGINSFLKNHYLDNNNIFVSLNFIRIFGRQMNWKISFTKLNK